MGERGIADMAFGKLAYGQALNLTQLILFEKKVEKKIEKKIVQKGKTSHKKKEVAASNESKGKIRAEPLGQTTDQKCLSEDPI